ncbi:T9SS outer membrane translocon Sov/SprA [Sphingobacterium bovistauri]|uniref:Cell surface protein SprA n=1 Tax=Sphingobacterium bovistauri TaxID=2781959 RepID=A0ABS7Z4Z1_9SPHI|nr:cell surface protein SprA [Sphingobacterium bovistauri]MCA5003955.1 cell surface protein SprA [Sphingobacterium bovistauri]
MSLGDSLRFVNYSTAFKILNFNSFLKSKKPIDYSKLIYTYNPQTNLFSIQTTQFGKTSYLNRLEFNSITSKISVKKNWNHHPTPNTSIANTTQLIKPLEINSPLFDKIFGGNKIEITPKGSVDLSIMAQRNINENPLLAERHRKLWGMDFDQNFNLNLIGKIGERGQVLVNFSSDAEFDFENQIKFDYVGKPDDILQRLEIGNVNFMTRSQLLGSSEDLFGVKTQLQVGKLNFTGVLSQKRSDNHEIIITNGKAQRDINIPLSNYEANQHYFIAHYFRENYNKSLQNASFINSPIQITAIELWVSNRSNKTESSRDILALIDLAEKNTFNPNIVGNSASNYPNTGSLNNSQLEISNNLLIQLGDNARNPNSSFLQSFFATSGGADNYAKLNAAQKLVEGQDYSVNRKLGYISLNFPLNQDQVLALSYRFSANGIEYQVGDLSTDIPFDANNPRMLYTKLLKNEILSTQLPTWDLMMKNIYSIGGNNIDEHDVNLQIVRTDSKTAIQNPILFEGANTKSKSWLQLTGLDRLAQNKASGADGLLDFIEGITIDNTKGKLIFPVIEPFGKDMDALFTNAEQDLKDKYTFHELYTLQQIEAKQKYSNKDRYYLQGTVQSNSSEEFTLGIFDLKPNTVKVYAGGTLLQESVDYNIDYESGTLRFLNPSFLLSNNTIKVSIEDSSIFGSQQKTFIGGRLDYYANPNFQLGATFMRLSERPYTEKVQIGHESIANTMIGADINYSTNSRWLTRMIDKIPFIKTNEESTINFYGEIAYSKPGYARALQTGIDKNGVAYLDDFENNFSYINIKNQQGWQISGTPQLFPEHALINDLAYGHNRAQFAFYNIDPIFYQTSSLNPNIDTKFLTDHRSRRVTEQEVFPFKEIRTGTDAFLPTLDLAFYPMLRGPYNFSTSSVDTDDRLLHPQKRWGGMFKKLDQPDFESHNIEYLELWLMDPALTNPEKDGGDLYINLGNLSEDILKDGHKAVENAIPANGDKSKLNQTVWGNVSKLQPINTVFENSDDSRKNQDVGLDGLSNTDEETFYSPFINQMRIQLNPNAFEKLAKDPASDDYSYYRGNHLKSTDGILHRYQYINGSEGNSKTQNQSLEAYGVENAARTLLPDAEDISRDLTMNEADNYYQYRISLRTQDMVVGKNFVVDEHSTQVVVLNRNKEVKWYKLRIPIREFQHKYGNIQDFKSIRFIRLFLTNFADTTVLRFAQMQFIKSDWRKYNPDNTSQWVIADPHLGMNPPTDQSSVEVANINIEENGKKSPIPYVVPPHINRQIDYSNNNLDVQLNEQSLSLSIKKLKDGYGRAAFKNASYDLRPYGNIAFFVHAEGESLRDGDANAFIRIGTDDKEHYYEYEAPLKITPAGSTSAPIIWPEENNIIVRLETLREAKISRDNAYKNGQPWPIDQVFEYVDGKNKITIKGTPDLSKVRFYMLGIKNPLQSSNTHNSADNGTEINGEFWFNELRVTDFENKSRWAATAQLHVKLADLANISVSGTKMSAGFGDISQRISTQNRNERLSFDLMANAELGKFVHPKHAISIPMYFSYSKQIGTPEYNPYQGDILLQQSLINHSQRGKDSLLRIIQDFTHRKNFSIINARKIFNTQNSLLKPWNIENVSLSYLYNEYQHRDIYTSYSLQKNYRGSIDYTFNNPAVTFKEPFQKNRLFKSIHYNFMPSLLSFRMEVNRIYHENTFRDNASNNALPTYYNKNFNTNRIYGISWDLTKSLRIDFNATNYAIIDEPNGRVDGARKDTLWNNFWKLGRNMDYNHMLNFTYTLPLNKIPHLEWVNITTRYGSQFNWKSEPLNLLKNESIDIGNSIQNNRTIQFNPSLNFSNLFNKFRFYREGTRPNSIGVKDFLIRLLLQFKSINAAYTKVEGTYLPGYLPNSNMLGYSFSQNAPGWDFILGSQTDILNRARDNNWLATDTIQNNVYSHSYSENISAIAHTEPIKGLRLDFTASRIDNRNSLLPYQSLSSEAFYETGSYAVSQISFKTSFKDLKELYAEFIENKKSASEILGEFNPNSSGLDSKYFADGYDENQQDVVINSFLKTFLNKDYALRKTNKPTFPLPNWRLNYSGLSQLLGIEDIIRAININHHYQSQYTVANYFSNSGYLEEEAFPYVRDRNNNFIPKHQYSQVTLTDRFLPLIGLDLRFDNQMSFTAEYRKSRDLALSLENSQFSVLDEKSYIAGFGYRKLNTKLPFGLFADRNWKNDINFRLDLALNDRKISMHRTGVDYEETTGGNKNMTLNPSFDLTINRFYNVRLFYNSNAVRPYTSQTFATTYTYFGFSLRLLLY